MNPLKITTSPDFEAVLINYPEEVRPKMAKLRALIHESAEESDEIEELEETLKWGEPSFVVKKGSTLRMDWKEKSPGQFAVYFKCTSKLVPSFKAVFGKRFNYEGNRAIIFRLDENIPAGELKACIKAALNYHRVKHLPRLGM